jgi:tRNA threonylcarbamoyl adenosine modification protein YeaZ
MKILALELSTGRGSVALVDQDRLAFTREFANDRKHSGAFFECLEAAHQSCGAAALIVVGLGPGSYAGVRIAISAAVGLQAAYGGQLIGIASICATDTSDPAFCVIGDARRNSFFYSAIANGECEEGPILTNEETLRDRLRDSPLPVYSAEALPQFAQTRIAYPSAARLAQLAQQDRLDKILPPLQPIYLREAHITQPKQPAATWSAIQ